MIVLDIESSGLDTGKCGIWQIGAVELENPKNQFLEESRIDEKDEIDQEALKVNGQTEGGLRDKNKQSQKQLILNFIDVVNIKSLGVTDLAKGGVGRLTVYTEQAIKDLGEKLK